MPESAPVRWAKVIDHTRCIGCHACTTACKSENDVPLSVTRTYVKYVDVGEFPQARRAFQVTRCNQCEHAPCTTACPTAAMYRRHDGIVDFDKSICIGCKACIAACPYDAIFINPEDHSAEKCNFCAHRIDVGLEPACVVVCPTEAILVGDLADPLSKVAGIVQRDAVAVRRPEKETLPKLFYKGAHQATLDPLAARRPDGGLYMWSEQGDLPRNVASGNPDGSNSSAAALLSYDVPHRAPWDWRVSLYTWTKSVAAGAYLAALLGALAGGIGWGSLLWRFAAPLLGGAFLALTGIILILELEHPTRFHMIFTRPQWRSWLVRGAFVIAAYSLVLVAHLLLELLAPGTSGYVAWIGVPAAVMTAAYTAYLFAQAKARDLWQNPLAPAHLLVQALIAGAAALLPAAALFDVAALGFLAIMLALVSGAHLLLVLGEHTLVHTTAHARLAAHAMTRGAYARWFLSSLALSAVGGAAAWLVGAGVAPWLIVIATPAALAGLFAYEHAYVQAGQSVPLA
jgi:Fe-S-cluster-containing dehydrogenase component/formate-dependent nitrite reductase membrane component NrfD